MESPQIHQIIPKGAAFMVNFAYSVRVLKGELQRFLDPLVKDVKMPVDEGYHVIGMRLFA